MLRDKAITFVRRIKAKESTDNKENTIRTGRNLKEAFKLLLLRGCSTVTYASGPSTKDYLVHY